MTCALIDSPSDADAPPRLCPDREPGDHDDMVLVQACKMGDAAAFEQIVKRYDRRLLRIAQHITHNLEDAQDAVQEAFLKVFRRLTQFQEKSKFSTWLMRITINESLMRLRKLRSIKELPLDAEFRGEEAVPPVEVVDSNQNPAGIATCNKSRLRLTRCRGIHNRGNSGSARVNSIRGQGEVVAGSSGIAQTSERLLCRPAFAPPGDAVTDRCCQLSVAQGSNQNSLVRK
jgi:RNA polymerase sigma factor (sigma-70 family)